MKICQLCAVDFTLYHFLLPLMEGMRAALRSLERGDPTGAEAFVASARHYIDLLRKHIQKEDRCLFPMARQALGRAELDQLADEFATIDREAAAAVAADYPELADRLAEKYGVDNAAGRLELAQACCHAVD